MATAGVQRPPQRAAESYGDYIPDDFADFGELFSDDEQAGPGSKSASAKAQQGKDDGTAGLGIDKEVSVTKRPRDPRVKLDESRLLSAKGIPALRKQACVLKLKGKGHEFSDASRLLSMYQLWLDDLFPKARFGDALAMVEKEGHKTSMHKMRMEWINESKPRDPEDDLDDETVPPPTGQAEEPLQQQHEEQTRPSSTNAEGPDSIPDDLFDDILYDATAPTSTAGPQSSNTVNADMGEVPDESELDALMADAMEIHGPEEYLPPPRRVPEDDFGDLDALIAEAEAAT